MKKINFNIVAASFLCLGLGMTSCTQSFLDVESKTESTTGNFYKTERMLIGLCWAVTTVSDWQPVIHRLISWSCRRLWVMNVLEDQGLLTVTACG